ncbi:hypothetical protein [Kitasatospora sp. NPDC059327]|uniref:hypothetical protein n=1 Tax=Kitasatospora sp. NPDC059327 TaxID=3346803 RepID=UPI003697003E
MTARWTSDHPRAVAFGRPSSPGDGPGDRPSRAARPGLRLVVTDPSTPDRDEQDCRDPWERDRIGLYIDPAGRCCLRFPRATSRPRTRSDDSVRTGAADLPAEHRRVLELALSAARRHDLALAVQGMDQLLITLATTYGARHRYTLTAAEARADLAWLAGDARCAAKLWTLVADGWARLEGPASRPARFAVRQAAASWRLVPDAEAAAVGAALLATLLVVAPNPESNPLVLAVRRRMSRVAALPR